MKHVLLILILGTGSLWADTEFIRLDMTDPVFLPEVKRETGPKKAGSSKFMPLEIYRKELPKVGFPSNQPGLILFRPAEKAGFPVK